MAKLRRVSDGAGDEGASSLALKWDKDKNKVEIEGNRPILGCSMQVGSVSARSYAKQDWWLTTEIIEILIDEPNYVKFKTLNSIYEWWR